jgi:DNA helicase-2/ATP-dependent DNA helicase PcrA
MLPSDAKIYCGHKMLEIKDVREDTRIVASSGWGETADADVKDVFVNNVSATPLLQITTNRGAVLRCTPDQLCFGRFNPTLRTYTLYLHERSSLGFRIGLTSDIIHEALGMMTANAKLDGKRSFTDRIWVIENNPNLTLSTFMHKLVMAKYGLPDIPFNSKHKDSMLSDELIKKLFDSIDTPVGGKELLRDSNMFIEHPHMTLKLSDSDNPNSNSVQFVIFGGKEKGSSGHYPHLIQIQGISDPNSADQFKIARRQRSNHGLWYLEVTREDLEEAELFVKTVSNLDDLEVVKKIQLTKKAAYYVLPASHLKRGMLVPVLNTRGVIEEDVVNKIEIFDYDGPLYDLQVNQLHNFITGQWVVMCYTPSSKPKQSYI